MARSRTTEYAGYTNPEVRFERSDIESRGIFVLGVGLASGIVLVALAMLWFGNYLLSQENPRKKTDLPSAKVDANRLPPEPRLEALEDLARAKVKLYPPRAVEYLKAQRELLDAGDNAKGVLPIQTAIDDLAGKLPVRKAKGGRP